MKKTLSITISILIVLAVHSKGAFTQQVKPEASKLLNDAIGLLTTDVEGMPSADKIDSAIAKLENAVKLEPSYYEAYVELGIAYRAKSVLLSYRAETRIDSKKYEIRSRDVLQKAISIAPNKPQAYNEYLHVANKSEWKKIVHRLYELDPNNPDVMYIQGYELIEEGKVEEGAPLVLKGMSGVGEVDIWTKKEELAEVLKKKGYTKKADEITHTVNSERKFHEGKRQLMYQDVDSGLRLISESVDGDLKRLNTSQKASVAKELENRERFKDAAQMFELIDPIKHKDHIKDLKNKAASQKKSKPEER